MCNIAIMRSAVDDSNRKLLSDPILEMPGDMQKQKTSGSPFHVALTATDAPYSRWQSHIMYYWYKKKKDLPHSEMGGFTRILHSGNPDNLMNEIPTIVVDPLPAGLDRRMRISSGSFFPEENGPVTNVDPIGNSPVIIKKDLLKKIAPTWMNVSLRMKDDSETDKAFGWVLEMYAYAVASAVASALHGVRHVLRKDFMLQPP